MSNVAKIKSIKAEIAEISKHIVNQDYQTAQEKHDLQKRKWILKRMLSAIEAGEDYGYLDIFQN